MEMVVGIQFEFGLEGRWVLKESLIALAFSSLIIIISPIKVFSMMMMISKYFGVMSFSLLVLTSSFLSDKSVGILRL